MTWLLLGAALAQDFDALLAEHRGLTSDELMATLPDPGFSPELGLDVRQSEDYALVTETLELTPEERARLDEHGFVLVDHDRGYSMGGVYFAVYTRDLPVLVTTDSVLHAMHRTFDAMLMELEADLLAPTLRAVLTRAHAALRVRAPDDPPAFYADVDLYLTVALNLLDGAADPAEPPLYHAHVAWDGRLLVQPHLAPAADVLTVLRSVQSRTLQTPESGGKSLLYGQKRYVDYSQFKPRGHYDKSVDLQRYFRAMMWLGRPDTGFEIERDRQLAAAGLLAELLRESGGEEDLAEMDALIGYLVGQSDNLSPTALLARMGAAQLRADDLLDPAAAWTVRAGLDGGQRIRSQVVVSNPDEPPAPPPRLFQLFGQRFVLDSFVLSQVVYDSILFDGEKVERWMPTGLDVAAALGNDYATRMLKPELDLLPYAANLQATRLYVAGLDDAVWDESVYNRWLASLRTLDAPMAALEHAPAAMKTEAWQRKMLQTQLASWAELRHDTILYAKQSYSGTLGCEYPDGYVEPYPALYAGVSGFAEAMADSLRSVSFRHAPDDATDVLARQASFLDGMQATLHTLQRLADKELAARPFTAEEQAFLKKTIDKRGGGSGVPRYDGWYPDLFYKGGRDASKWAPEIADVHTDPTSGQVLEVATGDADFLVMAVDNAGDARVYVGPAYSYYEFTHPASDRLTDKQWRRLLHAGEEPARPAWIDPVLGPPRQRTMPR